MGMSPSPALVSAHGQKPPSAREGAVRADMSGFAEVRKKGGGMLSAFANATSRHGLLATARTPERTASPHARWSASERDG